MGLPDILGATVFMIGMPLAAINGRRYSYQPPEERPWGVERCTGTRSDSGPR